MPLSHESIDPRVARVNISSRHQAIGFSCILRFVDALMAGAVDFPLDFATAGRAHGIIFASCNKALA